MTAAATLAALRNAGVRVSLRTDGRLDLNAAMPPAPELLDAVRRHRDELRWILRQAEHNAPAAAAPTPLADLPPAWLAGVARLATLAPPDGIEPWRWAVLASTSARLLRDHGTALHAAGWDTLDLFGLHQRVPATNPPGWGLGWLLGEAGAVLDVSRETVGMCREPGGARLAYRRRSAMMRAEVAPVWELIRPLF